MTDDTRRRGYHHGDARRVLIDAAGDLLKRTGASALSLRQVAEHAGLSRQAPYNHFRNKEALLAEVVANGFRQLTETLTAAISKSADNEQALAASGEAYIAFAQESPAMFRLMFARERVDLGQFGEVATASAGAFHMLSAVIARIAPEERHGDLSLAAWCLVHGYATLSIESGIEQPSMRKTRARQFADIIVASI